MKIRDRLSIQFTLIFALLLLLVLSTIYVTSEKNRKIDFNHHLRDRALTVAELFLAEDNLSKEKFQEVQKRYPVSLPEETVRMYNDRYEPVFIKQNSFQWSKSLIDEVIAAREIYFQKGNKQCVGIYYNDNSGNFVVIASAVDTYGLQWMRELLRDMLAAFFFSVIIMFLGGRLFARNALAPISKVISDVKFIRSTSLNKRVQTKKSKDELNELAITFNNLLEHLEQSFDTQRSFIANASHELRTPLTAITGDIEVTLAKERTAEEYQETLQTVLAETLKLNDLVNNLFELAQANIDLESFEDVRLDELIWQVKDEWTNKVPGSDIELIYNLSSDSRRYTIQGNRELLFIALGNIINNAIKFSGNKKIICQIDQAENTLIRIKDSGIGIPEGDLDKIFKPFQRGSNTNGFAGTGIGLSLTEKIIRLHGASIRVNTAYKEGTEFIISF
jgi:signal transduction histidine kinase